MGIQWEQMEAQKELAKAEAAKTNAEAAKLMTTDTEKVKSETETGKLYANTAGNGLLIKTYQSDKFNNWVSTEWIDGGNGISEITAISTAGDKFTIDQLNLSKKVYDMLKQIS